MQETQENPLDQEDPLEKEMATHSSILSWEIPWTEEPGRLQPMEVTESDVTKQDHQASLWLGGEESACRYRRYGFDPWVGKVPWRRKWQPTPVLLTGESRGEER